MGVWKKITKQLFGDQKAGEDKEIIIDGRIIRPGEPEHPAEAEAVDTDCTTDPNNQPGEDPPPPAETLPHHDDQPEVLPLEETGPWKLPASGISSTRAT